MADRLVDLDDDNDAQELEKLKKEYRRQSERSHAEANDTERSLSEQLILVTTVLITINVLVLGDGNLLKEFYQKLLITLTLLSEITSTIYGIRNYLDIENAFRFAGKIWQKCVDIISDHAKYSTFSELDRLTKTETDKIHDRDKKYLRRQIVFILFALLIYLIIVMTLLFTPTTSQTKNIKPCSMGHKKYSHCVILNN